MSFISEDAILGWEACFGRPVLYKWRWPVTDEDIAMVRSSQKNGRAHDITLFILRRGKLALIRKPFHERGVFRAPSGGLEIGETLEVGAAREAWEETGLTIALQQYMMRIEVYFVSGDDELRWTSHVFEANAIGGRLEPHDRREIASARYATVEELQGPIREALLASGRCLLAYRVALTDIAVTLLNVPPER
jgi:ADP-ribose pyrophosphatase YjhB (NUDIX family)